MIRTCLVMALIALAGCTTAPAPEQKIITVEKPVATPCIKRVPERPVYGYGKGEKPESDGQQALLLIQDFERAEQYGVAWEAAAAACIIGGNASAASPAAAGK